MGNTRLRAFPGKPLLLTLTIFSILLTSGCTSLGGFCIPGLTCGQTVEETHDVIVIESLQALPDNVPPGGTVKLIAIISNVADIDAEIANVDNIYVDLYDYCQGLFELKDCSGGESSGEESADTSQEGCDSGRMKISLLRGEKQQLEWTLQAKDRSSVPVKTECDFKIRAKYPYVTKSITTLHLIDYAEMQRRINQGTYSEIGSYISVGYGPIKPYIRVEGTQPIPVENSVVNTALSLQIINKGNGFLSEKEGSADSLGPLITRDMVEIVAHETYADEFKKKLDTCLDDFFSGSNANGIKLIKGESTKIPCVISNMNIGPVPVDSTKTIQATIQDYWYEFRKEIGITVEPKF